KEITYLNQLYERGKENGLENLKLLSEKELKEFEPHVNGIKGIHVPQTGIIDYTEVSQKLKEILIENGAEFKFNEEVTDIKLSDDKVEVITKGNSFSGGFIVSCAGLQSDRIAKMTNPDLPLRIIPFRGEYYKLTKEKERLVKTLIYPVPDPAFPFLGVHFTNLINGGVEAGPNAVFAFKREGYSKFSFDVKDAFESLTWPGFLKVAKKYWRTGAGEFYRSFSKGAFVKALRRLIPEVNEEDLAPGGAGVRAQACDKTGGLLDDFYFAENKRVIHVCNAPSPAATASLAIGNFIAEKIFESLND
ncbi:MAG: L-2-hydroxyglutarate oxidase, partial [Chlorobi bacterium]|nr:L-2-hydroxyglutarate oxidase [Chlorobiota bacterium]